MPLADLLTRVRACQICAANLPFAPNPVLRAAPSARLLIVGQAPGTKVHATGIPWNDPSGRRLRQWMGVEDETFYDITRVAIIPMGFCYPGRGAGGDLPPRPECAPQWHGPLLACLPRIRCTLLIGHYAQAYYLPDLRGSVGERVRRWREFSPRYFVLPHPSPRNQGWLRKHPWFEAEVVPALQATIRQLLSVR
ncbi:MAG: hypothetical protein RLZZ385_244 [Pseudomonadota bacterium]